MFPPRNAADGSNHARYSDIGICEPYGPTQALDRAATRTHKQETLMI